MSEEMLKFCRSCGEETPHDVAGDRCIPCRERRIAEVSPKEGEDIVAFALRMMEINRRDELERGIPVISQKSFVRKRGQLRKRLETGLRDLRKGSDKAIDTVAPAFVEHMRKIEETRKNDFENGPMRFMEAYFATQERIGRDPEYKRDLESAAKRGIDLNSRMVKPWREGREGRSAVKEKAETTKRSVAKRQFAISLRDNDPELTHSQIAEEITIQFNLKKKPCNVRTVQRYLNGR